MLYYATVGRAYLKIKLSLPTFFIINTNGPVLFFIYVSNNTKTPIVFMKIQLHIQLTQL